MTGVEIQSWVDRRSPRINVWGPLRSPEPSISPLFPLLCHGVFCKLSKGQLVGASDWIGNWEQPCWLLSSQPRQVLSAESSACSNWVVASMVRRRRQLYTESLIALLSRVMPWQSSYWVNVRLPSACGNWPKLFFGYPGSLRSWLLGKKRWM